MGVVGYCDRLRRQDQQWFLVVSCRADGSTEERCQKEDEPECKVDFKLAANSQDLLVDGLSQFL